MANPKRIRAEIYKEKGRNTQPNSIFRLQRPDGVRSTHITIRPQIALEEEFIQLLDWCQENNQSVNTIFNSFVPAIVYALWHDAFKDKKGDTYVHADFGDVLIRKKFSRL